jgi:hypothetical protein
MGIVLVDLDQLIRSPARNIALCSPIERPKGKSGGHPTPELIQITSARIFLITDH